MKSAFVDGGGALTAFGFMESNGRDASVSVPDDFDGVPGTLRYDGEGWVPYVDLAAVKAANQAARDGLLSMAALRIAPLQDASDLGTATSAEAASLLVWKQYRVAVNRVDLSAQDLSWPAAPA